MKKLQKPTKLQILKFIRYCLIVIAGNAVAASAAAFFIKPNGLVMGGTTGLGILVENLLTNAGKAGAAKWAGNVTVYAVNIALFILGAVMLGKKFAIATAAGTLLYPSFLSLWQLVNGLLNKLPSGNPFYLRDTDPLLAVIFGALIFGLGIGIVVRVGASTGGTDVPPLILNKYFGIPLAPAMWILDISIVLLQLIGGTKFPDVLYGILIQLSASLIVEKVALIGTKRAQVKIISRKYEEIRRMILDKLNRGVTMLYGKTGYLRDDCYMLLTIVSNRDVIKLKNAVQAIDPEAFFMVSIISEVRGNGFSSARVALPKSVEWQGEASVSDEAAVSQDKKSED